MIPEPIRLVLAEDNYLVSQEIKRCIDKRKYEIVGEAYDGEQAIELVCGLKPDIALFDIKMPKLDGLRATRAVQERCPTPVVILTAYESLNLVELASEVGAGAYLIKPPKPQDINRAVTIALARHNDLMELRSVNSELARRNLELEKAHMEIEILQGYLHICSHCKKIRGDDGSWHQLEKYISQRSKAQFSHGICQECVEIHYPDSAEEILGQKEST